MNAERKNEDKTVFLNGPIAKRKGTSYVTPTRRLRSTWGKLRINAVGVEGPGNQSFCTEEGHSKARWPWFGVEGSQKG